MPSSRAPDTPRPRWQFSLRQLLMVVTGFALLLMIPAALHLVGLVATWVVVGSALLVLLLILQAPFFLLLRLGGFNRGADEPERRHDEGAGRESSDHNSETPRS